MLLVALRYGFILLSWALPITLQAQPTDWVSYVNPLMGTDSEFSFSNGNTYPSISRPWGMNAWAPQTRKAGDGWFYRYADRQINGIKQ
ncbi:hypothetical protein RZS08_15240, partial [Arthrospira platensis SPKY1]|nr:hypothetical protein [Arthrospira platensis SPKY1]